VNPEEGLAQQLPSVAEEREVLAGQHEESRHTRMGMQAEPLQEMPEAAGPPKAQLQEKLGSHTALLRA
jgi:hypothetical protein